MPEVQYLIGEKKMGLQYFKTDQIDNESDEDSIMELSMKRGNEDIQHSILKMGEYLVEKLQASEQGRQVSNKATKARGPTPTLETTV